MITVGVCYACNNGKSSEDVYLRDYLLADIAAETNSVVQELRMSTFKRSVQTNRSEIARTALKWARRVLLRTSSGIYAGPAFAVPINTIRLESIYKRMVIGLYYYFTNTYLPRDYQFQIVRVDAERSTLWSEMRLKKAVIASVSPDVFECQYKLVDNYPTLSRWLLLFYNRILITVSTFPPSGIASLIDATEPDAF